MERFESQEMDDDFLKHKDIIDRIKNILKSDRYKFRTKDEKFYSDIGISKSAFEKTMAPNSARNTHFRRWNTINKICKYLEIDLFAEHADAAHGGYARKSYESLAGNYYLIRPTFDQWDTIGRFHMAIRWSREHSCLIFHGTSDKGYAVQAKISIPLFGQYIKIHSSDSGYHSLMIVRMMDEEGCMYGQILTLGEAGGGNFRPISGPVVIIQADSHEAPHAEIISKTHKDYSAYMLLLKRVYKLDNRSMSNFFEE